MNFLIIFCALSLEANFFPLAVGGNNNVKAINELVTTFQS